MKEIKKLEKKVMDEFSPDKITKQIAAALRVSLTDKRNHQAYLGNNENLINVMQKLGLIDGLGHNYSSVRLSPLIGYSITNAGKELYENLVKENYYSDKP